MVDEKINGVENEAPPKIEFPCDYPIKVIGDASHDLVDNVLRVLVKYDASLSLAKIEERPSKKGNYCSVRVDFYATGEDQLKSMFEELKTHTWVRMVL
ncbi:MAG: putative lipoic acid-binding regulatory protein [Candidatus Azotimanducaceae bacterium]|jgi:putative lipoic acid-binding regulatory protein